MSNFEPGEPSQRRFAGYGAAKFPDPRDAELDTYVSGLWAGGPEAVRTALRVASQEGQDVLSTYAERAASRAVRTKSINLLRLALVALVVAGLVQNDPEALMPMALVEDAGRRIGAEPGVFFGEVADHIADPATSVSLMRWLCRSSEDRSPECMGFEAAQDASGFRYVWKG